MIFKGCGTALITPFSKNGIDFDAFSEQIEYQLRGGISALAVCGTTGEPSTMTEAERREAIGFVIECAKKRVPVIAGTGTNSTASTVKASVDAEKLGADALLLVTPYYNKCTQKGLVAHYSEVSKACGLPMIFYNVPKRTGMTILPETYAELAKLPNAAGIKEASGNLANIQKAYELTKGRLDMYSGDDDLTVDIMELGAIGLISVASNVIPKAMSDICSLMLGGKKAEAESILAKHAKLIGLLFSEVSPIPVKTAVNLQKRKGGALRLPLTEMEEHNKSALADEMRKLNLL